MRILNDIADKKLQRIPPLPFNNKSIWTGLQASCVKNNNVLAKNNNTIKNKENNIKEGFVAFIYDFMMC